MKRALFGSLIALLVLSACAGREDAANSAKILSNILSDEGTASDRYAKNTATYVNSTHGRTAENAAQANRVQADIDMLAGNLDLTGKGTATDLFKKHVAMRPAAIQASPFLANQLSSPWTPPDGDPDMKAAIKSLKPIAQRESAEDVAFFLGIVSDGYRKLKEQQEAAESGQPNP